MEGQTSERIRAFDWLRGLAVVVMIQTHCQALLLPGLMATQWGRALDRIDGLVAPAFLFSAGFALALVQVRAASASSDHRLTQTRRTLKRVGVVLGVATLINFIWFPMRMLREPKWLLRLDILHCIGLSLLIALPFLVGLLRRPTLLRWVFLALATTVFVAAPWAESAEGVASLFLTRRPGFLDATTASTFPLFPWSGYIFLGASFGTTVAAMRHESQLWRWWTLLVGLGATLWAFQPQLKALYGPHDFWTTNPASAGQRWTLVLGVLALFRLLERRMPAFASSRLARFLSGFGTWSLSAYFFHEMLLFQRHIGLFGRWFRAQADWPLYWALVIALVGLTWLCCRWWHRFTQAISSLVRLARSPTPPQPR